MFNFSNIPFILRSIGKGNYSDAEKNNGFQL